MRIEIEQAVNVPLLRQELDAAGIDYSFEYGGDTLVLVSETVDACRAVLAKHDANQLTEEQRAQQEAQQQAEQFLQNVEMATAAINQMALDTVETILRINASAMDATVKVELVLMNSRTAQLLQALQPFIARVVELVRAH